MSLVTSYPQTYGHPGPAAAPYQHDLYSASTYPHFPEPSEIPSPYFPPQSWMIPPGHGQDPAAMAAECYSMAGEFTQQTTLSHPACMDASSGLLHPCYEIYHTNSKTRVVKRKVTANKKERKRTVSINTAFADLRGCIPNVPSDTKLSKIKTLRLATSYIAYLMDVLARDDPNLSDSTGFKAEIPKTTKSENSEKRRRELEEMKKYESTQVRSKGRTGWPQAVWAQELVDHCSVSGISTNNSNSSPSGHSGMSSDNSTDTPHHPSNV